MANEDLLRKIFFFKDFTDNEISLVDKIALRSTFAAGQKIFTEGEEASQMYLVVLGTIQIVKGDSEKEVAKIGPGETFGELPFLDGGERSAAAVALEKTELLQVPYSKLVTALLNNPETALKFYIVFAKYVSRRLRDTTQNLERVADLNRL